MNTKKNTVNMSLAYGEREHDAIDNLDPGPDEPREHVTGDKDECEHGAADQF